MSGETILVVDDEAKIVKTVRAYLENAGFRVTTAGDGQAALTAFRHERPALVVLDLGLPGIDGLDVARTLRQESSVPIIMLTARVEETDRLIGLELGADDYVTKPFSPRELVARVRAVLRRAGGEWEQAPPPVVAGDIAIDLERRQVTVAGRPADLTPTEFELLALLARHPGRVFTRLELLTASRATVSRGTSAPSTPTSRTCASRSSPIPSAPATSSPCSASATNWRSRPEDRQR